MRWPGSVYRRSIADVASDWRRNARTGATERHRANRRVLRTRRTKPCVFVTPFSHPTLGRELAAAGFAPSEYDNVMASEDLGDWARRDPRVVEATDLQAWARASVEAFMHPQVPKTGDELVACVIASSPGVWPLEVRHGDTIAATAAMDLQEGCAGLFGGSVMAPFRGRGFHLALIHDRIARAREAGASLLRATAQPASASERNFRRCGFTTLYTRRLWEREIGESGKAGDVCRS